MSDQPPQYTNYPRAAYQTNRFGRPPGVYIDSIQDAWTLVRSDTGTWVLSAIVAILVSVLFYGGAVVADTIVFKGGDFFYEPRTASEQIVYQLKSLLFSLPAGAVVNMIWVGMMNMGARQASGSAISVGDIFLPFRRFGHVFLTSLLVQIATTIGFAACIVPGIYLSGAFSLAPLIALNQDVNPIEAMGRSFRTLGSGAWLMFLVLMLTGIIITLGGCLCGVGALVALPIGAAWMGLHYFYFFPPEGPAYSPTSEGFGA